MYSNRILLRGKIVLESDVVRDFCNSAVGDCVKFRFAERGFGVLVNTSVAAFC